MKKTTWTSPQFRLIGTGFEITMYLGARKRG
jgi:coenzyme PQQ precursor peptide PqqA